MPDDFQLDKAEERSRRHEAERTTDVEHQGDALQTTEEPLPYSPSLLGDPRMSGRGNSPVQRAILQRMQQTYGNRATRQYVQRHSARSPLASPLAVQRHPVQEQEDEEEQQKPVPVSRMPANGSHASVAVQRHPVQEQEDEEEEQKPVPVSRMPISGARTASAAATPVQRQEGDAGGPGGETGTQPGGGTEAPQAAQASGLIVDDAVSDLQPGQMHKGEFLSSLRAAIDNAADQALSGTPYGPLARPQIEQEFAKYAGMGASALEAAIRQQVPGASGAQAASEYIPMVCARVTQEIQAQLPKDGIEGLLAEGAGALAGIAQGIGSAVSGAMQGIGSALGGAARSVGSAASGIAGGIGKAVSSIGSLFFKAREGGAHEAEAGEVSSNLGSGQPLDGGVRGGLESAFGTDLSGVRVHTDGQAGQVSDSLNARAFTVGSDIAFGSGEYQPGTPVGDALIAHEVAHVVQQGNGAASGGVMAKSDSGGAESALEEDADVAAVGAVMSMWNGAKSGLTTISRSAMPALRTGLRLQRCGKPKLTEDEAKRLENIKNNVKRTSQGTHAIEVIDKYSVGAIFTDGPGSVFDPNDNTIKMDRNRSDLDLTFTYIHESNHAEYSNKKMSADVMKDTRDGYVDKMLSEETEGQALSILAKMELEATPGDLDMSKATERAGESSFKKGYKKAYDEAKAASKSDADAKTAGIAAGKVLLRKDFDEGITIVTSNTHESYKVYYGKEWDKRHTK